MGAYLTKLFNSSLNACDQYADIRTREDLVASIRGARVKIPDLQSMLAHWPQHVHPEVDRLEKYVQKTLDSVFPEPEEQARLRKMKASEFALFTASWWAYASFEKLCVVASLSIWLFVVDDEMDSAEYSSLVDNFTLASKFRQETLKFIAISLSRDPTQDVSLLANNRMMKCFEHVGEALKASYNDRQLSVFAKEVAFFIDMCQEEHKVRLSSALPTPEQYLQRRMGSSAVGICFAITEYATGINMPEEIMQSEPIKIIWHESNIIISIVNDILSIKKEIAQSQADTMVPVLVMKLRSVQAAVDEATVMVAKSIRRFDAAEQEILDRYASSPETQDMIREYVRACKTACTANLNWSLVSARYQLYCTSTTNGINVVL
ncbi:terpenoid synthase [Xylaria intraflava]|nr:terpenoid synthase [Xylaria intraflava]